jgi:hypothetical protein
VLWVQLGWAGGRTYQNLGRPGRHIDRDERVRVVLEHRFRSCYPLVVRSEDLVSFQDRLSFAMGWAPPAMTMGDVDNFWRDGAICTGKGGEDDGVAAGDLGWDAEHERGGGEDGCAAGDIEPDAGDGSGESGADDAWCGFYDERGGFGLGFVEFVDVGVLSMVSRMWWEVVSA